MKSDESNARIERENLINEVVMRVLGSLFRLAFVYLLGVYTPVRIKARITYFFAEFLDQILSIFEILH